MKKFLYRGINFNLKFNNPNTLTLNFTFYSIRMKAVISAAMDMAVRPETDVEKILKERKKRNYSEMNSNSNNNNNIDSKEIQQLKKQTITMRKIGNALVKK